VRPADGLETAAAWAMALERRDGPTLMALTRQNLPALERPADFEPAMLRRGGYVLRDTAMPGAPTLIATGSEVGVAVAAAAKLAAAGTEVRVVSMPAPQRFLEQDEIWRRRVLPADSRRISFEAGATDYWHRFVGADGLMIGIDRFGESAPLAQLQEFFGFTPDAVAARVREWLGGTPSRR
jgi:transketolase